MNIDEILERAEKVEEKTDEDEQGNELLSAFKVRYGFLFCNDFYFQAGEGFRQDVELASWFSFFMCRLLIFAMMKMMQVSGVVG